MGDTLRGREDSPPCEFHKMPEFTAPTPEDETYQGLALERVSRTFALTIPQLPDALRRIVGNAYLLCRIADTIEDDSGLSPAQQQCFSDQFIAVVRGEAAAEAFAASLAPALSAQIPEAERELVRNTASVIRITHSFNARQRRALERCVRIMAQGMASYQQRESLAGLRDLPDMWAYCYYVAGVVGEMLTELFCDYSPEMDAQHRRLMPLAVSFGQALQMTNILKDTWEDRARGACWLPSQTFAQHGVELKTLVPGASGDGFRQGLLELIGVTHGHLTNALTYTLAIPVQEKGIRLFCLWALGMALLTLRKLKRHPEYRSGAEVKISRRSVKAVVFLTNILVSSDILLKLLFKLAAKGLPAAPNNDTLNWSRIPFAA